MHGRHTLLNKTNEMWVMQLYYSDKYGRSPIFCDYSYLPLMGAMARVVR